MPSTRENWDFEVVVVGAGVVVGIRPKISGPDEPPSDFRIEDASDHGVPGLINLYGIESPGLTSCLAIGAEVAFRAGLRAERLEEQFQWPTPFH